MRVTLGSSIIASLRTSLSSSLWTVLGLLVISEVIYVELARYHAVNTIHSVSTFFELLFILFLLYGAAYGTLRSCRASSRRALTIVVAGAILFRITLLFAGLPPDTSWKQAASRLRADLRSEAVTFDSYLLFDNDVWRYLWDGHVGAEGISPYLFEPRNPSLDALTATSDGNMLWGDIRANVNHADTPTIYPPFAQFIFLLAHEIAPGSVVLMKLLLVACDLLAVLFVALTLRALHRPVTEVILYAWNPLIIKAVAASGHMDAILAMLLSAMIYFAVRRWKLAAVLAWGLAVLTKVSPIMLLPFLARRMGWRRTIVGVMVVLLGYVPYWDKQGTPLAGLRIFASEWRFNSGFLALVEWLGTPFSSHPVFLARTVAAFTLLVLMVWLTYLDDGNNYTLAFYCVTALGALVVLSPTVMPWYFVGILPLAVIARTISWIQFSFLVCLAFFVMVDGTERVWILWIEFGTLAVLLWRECERERGDLVPRQLTQRADLGQLPARGKI